MPSDILRETYVNLERDLERYRQQAGYYTFFYRETRRNSVSDEKPEEKADNPLEEEKTRAEIEGIHIDNRWKKWREIFFIFIIVLIAVFLYLNLKTHENKLEWLSSIIEQISPIIPFFGG